MAPKKVQKPKGKEKMVHDLDIIPMKSLNKHGIDSKTVKILKNLHIWNDVLVTNNRKSLLAEIEGLTDTSRDHICEAVDKIMDSLNIEVDDFIQRALAALEKEWHKVKCNDVKRVFREAQECVKAFYTVEEMRERICKEFDLDDAADQIYDRFLATKKGHTFYKQLSSIRAAQRKAEQKQVGEERAEQKEEPSIEKEEPSIEKEPDIEKEEPSIEKEEPSIEKEEPDIEKEEPDIEKEEPSIEKEEPDIEKEEPESLLPALSQPSIEKEEPESLLPALSQQVTTLIKALTSQKKMFEAVRSYQPEIATKEDLESLRIGIGGKLESLSNDLAIGMAAGIENILTSSSSQPSKTLEQTVSSEVRVALSELETTIKESIAADAVANVTGSIKERMSFYLVQGNYDACFSMALDTDDATLGWLLTMVKSELLPYFCSLFKSKLLPHFPLSKQTLRSILLRLTDLVTVEAGEYTHVFCDWFQAIRDEAAFSDLEISEEMMRVVRAAEEHVHRKYYREFIFEGI